MPKKPHHKPGGPATGNEFIELAGNRGAKISHSKTTGFTAVETPSGKVHINPSDQNLDRYTRSNLRRWFRLLGLMSVAFTVAKIIGEAIGLF